MAKKKDWVGNKNSVYKAIGASNHTEEEREEHDYYATEPKAIDVLLNEGGVTLAKDVWEPACGEKHLSNRLVDYGYNIRNSDIIDRVKDGSIEVLDFFECNEKWDGDIVTNPPYKYAIEFVEKALSLVSDGRKVYMFLKLTFLEGQKRKKLFKKYPPKCVYVSSSRIICAKNGDFENTDGSAVAYAWFEWVKGYSGGTIIKWIN